MIEKDIVYQLVREGLAGTDCFIVDVQVKPGNVIIVEIDNKEGVDIDRCVSLHRFIGITSPFKVIEQYQKNIGNEVEVLTKAGMKLNGILKSVSDDKFVVTIIKKVKTETSKRKVAVEEDLTFGYDEIKYTKYLIRFK